jgi:hypothetical protein
MKTIDEDELYVQKMAPTNTKTNRLQALLVNIRKMGNS